MGFLDDISNKNEILRWVVPIGIGVAVMVLTLLLRRTIYWRLHKWAAKTETKWDDVLIHSTRIASMLWCFFLGIYTAVEVAAVPASWEGHLDDIVPILFVVMGIYTGVVITRVFIEWYIVEVAEKTASPLDDMIMGALKWIVPLIAIFLGLVLVLDMLDIESLETKVLPPVKNWLRHPGPQIALLGGGGLALVLLATAAIPKVIREAVTRSRSDQSDEEVNKRADTLSGVLVASLQAVIIAVVLFMMLSEIGLNISPIIAGVGVIGIAIGFGAQSLVKDLIAGLFIIMENQYRKGDVVKIADTSGLVEDINLRRTLLRDMDGVVHSVPNGEIRVASNYTKEWSRVNMNISVSYDTDLKRAMEVINRVGKELAEDPDWMGAILTPPRALRVDNLGDSGIDIKIMGETKPMRQWDVMGELRLRLKKAFDVEGIDIPYPHTKVYFGNAPVPFRPQGEP
ncbi:MAG: mechanosensitive ion channel family protein [Chloroflexi bacterium]|nr:mechanosensitive ion channel family protein [Chloroflexota bacterium]